MYFEISRYTGRIHFYYTRQSTTTTTSKKAQPTELKKLPFNISRDAAPTCPSACGKCWQCDLQSFLEDHQQLTPYQRRLLSGKPARSPLFVHLSSGSRHLSVNTPIVTNSTPSPTPNSTNYSCKDLKMLLQQWKHTPNNNPTTSQGNATTWNSTRRYTPRTDPHQDAPPTGCFWALVDVTYPMLGRTVTYPIAAESDGTLRCIRCVTPLDMTHRPRMSVASRITGMQEHELFCSGDCRADYFIRCSGKSLRRQLFQLEQGICADCSLDCHSLWWRLKTLAGDDMEAERRELLFRTAPAFRKYEKLANNIIAEPTEGKIWQADHVKPVHKGGGECGLENLQTLCAACHMGKTIEEAKARKAKRKQEQAELKQKGLVPPKKQKKEEPAAQAPEVIDIDDDSECSLANEGVALPPPQHEENPVQPQNSFPAILPELASCSENSAIEEIAAPSQATPDEWSYGHGDSAPLCVEQNSQELPIEEEESPTMFPETELGGEVQLQSAPPRVEEDQHHEETTEQPVTDPSPTAQKKPHSEVEVDEVASKECISVGSSTGSEGEVDANILSWYSEKAPAPPLGPKEEMLQDFLQTEVKKHQLHTFDDPAPPVCG
eukprot:TRINITY_DN17101_c0_g1_i2.p1 TRINITY_DN17101_c0_g1~~TRINITY_DN17101_c0_g1_i2.p1  ORF type:complete len:605 (+),score=77.32 TRINITY_DN17101_c0_g1_i2:2-1816(+)